MDDRRHVAVQVNATESLPAHKTVEESRTAQVGDQKDQEIPPGHHGSIASFLADREAQVWCAGEPVRIGESVSEAIARFSPQKVPAKIWASIEVFVRECVDRAAPTTVYDAGALMTVVSQLVLWVHTLGQPIETAVVFHPDTIDRFTREGLADKAGGTQFNYRRQLRAVGAAILGPDAYPPPPLELNRSDPSAPYTEREIARLWAWCRGLPTERYRHNISVVLAYGLGAALTGQELSYLVGTDVTRDDDGVVIDVVRHNPRVVPVLRRWEDLVFEKAQLAGDGPIFIPERRGITRRQIPNFIARCPKGDAPPLNMVRLRVSWIVNHLNAGANLLAIAKAAGVEPAQIVRYARYATPLAAEEARRQLRWAGGV